MEREVTNSQIANATVRNIRIVYPSFDSHSETFSQPLTLKGLAKDEESEENSSQTPSPAPESMPQSDTKDN